LSAVAATPQPGQNEESLPEVLAKDYAELVEHARRRIIGA